MDVTEVEGANMVEEHDHPMNHRLGEEGMNMVEEHYHSTKYQLEVEDMVDIHMVEVGGMNMVEEHYHPMNHQSEVEGIDMKHSDIGEDMTVEVEVVERENEGVVLVRH
jgi:hypothetical protein